MKKGDIVLINFPFSDLKGSKIRPAVVLIATESEIVLLFITTQLKWKLQFDLELEPNLSNNLKKNSLLRLSKITSVDKSLILGKIGELAHNEIVALNKNLIQIFELHQQIKTHK